MPLEAREAAQVVERTPANCCRFENIFIVPEVHGNVPENSKCAVHLPDPLIKEFRSILKKKNTPVDQRAASGLDPKSH